MKIKSLTCMFLCLLMVVCGVACSTTPISDTATTEMLSELEEMPSIETVPTETEFEFDLPLEEAPQVEVTLYAGNKAGFVVSKMNVEELTEHVIIDFLSSMSVLNKDVKVNSFKQNNKQIQLDFNKALKDELDACDSDGEKIIIDSIVNSFIENYDVESVVITVEGKTLETKNNVYDEPLKFVEY